MHRMLCKITITQKTTTEDWPVRNSTFIFKFVNEIEVNSSWQNMTDTCKIILPKKVYVFDENGKRINWTGHSVIGSDATVPLILRGDKIKIETGYNYPTPEKSEVIETNIIFDGFVSKVNPRLPIELTCEDRMFELKQKKVANKVYSNLVYDVQDMIQEMLLQYPELSDIDLITGSKVGEKIETNLNAEFRTLDDTIASVLIRLKKEAGLYSYFRNVYNADGTYTSQLRCSGLVYFPEDRQTRVFSFQKNIISDKLEYKRKEDIFLGAHCYSLNKVDIQTTNKNGKKKTKQKKLEAFIGNKDGEIRTIFVPNVHDVATLKKLAERQLRKFWYTGYYGTFTTFGLPFVKHGDEVMLQDSVLPERNGGYLVKSVRTTFGMGGYRQHIELHLKISIFTKTEIDQGL